MIAMMERVSVGVFPLRHTYGGERVVQVLYPSINLVFGVFTSLEVWYCYTCDPKWSVTLVRRALGDLHETRREERKARS